MRLIDAVSLQQSPLRPFALAGLATRTSQRITIAEDGVDVVSDAT